LDKLKEFYREARQGRQEKPLKIFALFAGFAVHRSCREQRRHAGARRQGRLSFSMSLSSI
jgi:hypothetical protein